MVREIKNDELNELLELYLQLHESTIPQKDEHLMKVWQEIIEDKNQHVIVNIIDEKIVSSCVCVVIPNLTRNVRPYALIENVVTNECYRKKGYASECLDYAKRIAENAGCYKVMLLTGTKNDDTLKFYENAGFNRFEKTGFIYRIDN